MPPEVADNVLDIDLEALKARYREEREKRLTLELVRQAERFFLLSIIDRRWIQHIDALDELREGVQLQSVGQRDPLVEFRTRAGQMFDALQKFSHYCWKDED